MRVGLVIERFRPSAEIAGKWAYQLARELLSRGHEVHVVAQSFGPEAQRLPIVEHALGEIRAPLALAAAAGQAVHALALDVIHDLGTGWYCDVFQPFGGSPLAARERSLALAPPWRQSMDRALWPLLPGHRGLEALWARQFVEDGRLFVVPSRRVARDLAAEHRVPREQLRRIYGGVDPERYSPFYRESHREPLRQRLRLDDDTLLVLFSSENPRLDGLPTLLRAVAWLASRRVPVHLLVAGGKLRGAAMRRAAALHVAHRVSFTGPIDDLVPLYAAADVYAQPTAYDPNGLTALEALASGLPVITSEYCGISELLDDGREGFVVEDPTDTESLAQRLESLASAATREPMAQAARQLALRYTLDRHLGALLAVYDEVVRSQRMVA